MININQLIQNAYTSIGIVGDGQSVNGTKAKIAELEINNLLGDLNLQEYILDNIKSFDVDASKTITIGENAACMVNHKPPATIRSVSLNRMGKHTNLINANIEAVNRNSNSGLASLFTYQIGYDSDLDIMVGKITLDGSRGSKYKVIFLDDFENVTINDVLYLHDKYNSLLLNGLCYKLSIRFKRTEYIPIYKGEFDSCKDLIKSVNSSNRPLIMDDDDYLTGYERIMMGYGW